MELSTTSIIIISVLTLVITFILLPAIFNNAKKLWYLKKNSGPCGFKHESMFYDAKRGQLIDDQMPIH